MSIQEKLTFRDLKGEEIEVRVQSISKKGAILLLYKNARCDMNILDETVGAERWQRKHYQSKDTLFCSVGIKVNDEWIWKDDAGEASRTSAEKGEASDSFKRACVNWGIGRELYTSPFIWVKAADLDIKEIKGKFVTYDKFDIEKIKTTAGKVAGIAIKNAKTGKRVFVWADKE